MEGIHALVSGILRRAPAAKLPYLSNELRFGGFLETVLRGPEAEYMSVSDM